jgi:hypothetical protein
MIYVNKNCQDGEHFNGTKVFVYPQKTDSQKLYDFVKAQGVQGDLVKPSQYHCTVIYSDYGCPTVEEKPVHLPMTGGIFEWKVFGSPQFGKCLVGVLNSAEIRRLNREIVETYGAVSRFPTFVPHITVAWAFEGEVPTELPRFSLLFDAYKVAGIDPHWTPEDLKK